MATLLMSSCIREESANAECDITGVDSLWLKELPEGFITGNPVIKNSSITFFIAENSDVQQEIIDLLGEESFVDGIYNTVYVAKRVFEDSHLLAALNAIIHPAVGLDIMKRKPDFVESAILFESGLDILCDRIIVIDAPEEIRIARTIARDYHGDASPANIDKVRARIKAQNIPTGDLFINNDGKTSIADLAVKILNWLKKVK